MADKRAVTGSLEPSVDRVLSRYRDRMVTSAYASSAREWTEDERACGLDRTYRIVMPRNTEITADVLESLRAIPIVEHARASRVGTAPLPPLVDAPGSAPLPPTERSRASGYEGRKGPSQRDWGHFRVGADVAHLTTRGAEEILIAVLDTGVDTGHPELEPALRPGFDFVDILEGADEFLADAVEADPDPSDAVGHGTHVTGILVSSGKKTAPGIAPRCRVLPVRVLGALRQGNRAIGAGLIDNINTGIKWAVDQGARVINMSLGIRRTGGGLPHADVVAYARRRGVTVVAASGNDGTQQLYYPGALSHVIAVGAIDADGQAAEYSTFGKQVFCVAPGTNVFSTSLKHGYAFSTGTSHAAPFVAGAAALLHSRARAEHGVLLADHQVKHVLQNTCDKLGRAFKDVRMGYGVLNLPDALSLLDSKLERTGARPPSRSYTHEPNQGYA